MLVVMTLWVFIQNQQCCIASRHGHTSDYCAPCLSVKDEGFLQSIIRAFFQKTSIDIINGVLEVGEGEVKEIHYESDGVQKVNSRR